MWIKKPNSEALCSVEECNIGPYKILTWKFKSDGEMGFNVTCGEKPVASGASKNPKQDGIRAATSHCCDMMKCLMDATVSQ